MLRRFEIRAVWLFNAQVLGPRNRFRGSVGLRLGVAGLSLPGGAGGAGCRGHGGPE